MCVCVCVCAHVCACVCRWAPTKPNYLNQLQRYALTSGCTKVRVCARVTEGVPINNTLSLLTTSSMPFYVCVSVCVSVCARACVYVSVRHTNTHTHTHTHTHTQFCPGRRFVDFVSRSDAYLLSDQQRQADERFYPKSNKVRVRVAAAAVRGGGGEH